MAHAVELRHRAGLVEFTRRIATWLPVIAIAYPMLLWPLIEPPAEVAHPDLAPPGMSHLGILNRIFFPPLFLTGIAVFAVQARVCGLALLRAPIVLTVLYVLWAAAGTLWALEPDIVLRRSMLQVTIMCSVILPAIAARDPRAVCDRLFWLFAFTGILNLGAVLLYPPGPIGHEGIYTHKNTLGGVAAMVFLFALLQAFSGGGKLRVLSAAAMTAIGLFLLIESESKTSQGLAVLIPVTAVAICAVTRTTRISPALLVPSGFAVLALIYWIGVATYTWDFATVADFVFGDPTLTRRTEIWDFALKMIERRPWSGYGYEAFWGVSFETPSIREAPGFIAKLHSGHNGFLDLIIHTGIIGLAIAMAALLALLHAAGRVARHSMLFGTTLLSLALSCIFYNFTETTFFHSFDLQHLIFLLTVGLTASAHDIIEGRARG